MTRFGLIPRRLSSRQRLAWRVFAVFGVLALVASTMVQRVTYQEMRQETDVVLFRHFVEGLLEVHRVFDEESENEGRRRFLTGYVSAADVEKDIRMAYRGAIQNDLIGADGEMEFALVRHYLGDEQPLDHFTGEPLTLRARLAHDYLLGQKPKPDELAAITNWDAEDDEWWTERLVEISGADDGDAGALALAEESPRRWYERYVSGGVFDYGFWALTLLFSISALLTLFRREPLHPHFRITKIWRPEIGLAVSCWALLIANQIVGLAGFFASYSSDWFQFGQWGIAYSLLLSIWLYAIQQLGAVVLAAVFLTGSWRLMRHLFRLQLKHLFQGPVLRLALGAYGLYAFVGLGLYIFERELIGSFDTRDFLYGSLIDAGIIGLGVELIIAAILAPVGEELLFRGFLFTSLRSKLHPVFAAFISSAIFAIMHFYSPLGVVSVLLFGMATCWIYHKSGTLWPGIIFHALLNFVLTVSNWYTFSEDFSWLGFYAW